MFSVLGLCNESKDIGNVRQFRGKERNGLIMATLLSGIILAVICVLYGIASKQYAKKDRVMEVEAGPVAGSSDCAFHTKTEPSRLVRLKDGRYVNTRDYIRIIVKGNCMRPRNIQDGEEWLVERINKWKPLDRQIKQRDVLLIYLADKNLYKIREFKDFNGNGLLNTFYYEENGTEHASSHPHTPESVRGVVRYAI